MPPLSGLNTGDLWVFEVVALLELDLSFFMIAAPAVVFAGISKGGFGSGAAFAAASILALTLPPGLALGVMLPLLMLMDVASLRPYWGKWRWHESRLLILGGIPGVALGAGLFSIVNDDVFRVLIGVISVAFVIWTQLTARGVGQYLGGGCPRLARRIGWVCGWVYQFRQSRRWTTRSRLPAVARGQ